MSKRASIRGDKLCLPAVEQELAIDRLLGIGAVGAQDTVVAGGSLIEGVGNEFSDLDLYVVSDPSAGARPSLSTSWRVISRSREILREAGASVERVADGSGADAAPFLLHVPLDGQYMKIDFEFRTEAEVTALGRRVAALYEYATQNLELFTKQLDERELSLIHRLHTGLALHGTERAERIIRQIDPRHFGYVLYRRMASDFSMVLDALGAWRRGRLADCALLVRDKLMLEMAGLMSLGGVWVTNPKWLLSYLQQIDRGERTCRVENFFALQGRFVQLFAAMSWSGADSYRDYVIRCADLMDDIYDAAAVTLAQLDYPSGEAGRQHLRSSIKDAQRTMYAALELEHRLLAYGERRRPFRNLFTETC